MKILIINNKGQYNHRIGRSLKYLNIPYELVSNELSIEEIKEKKPMGLIFGGGPSIEESGNSSEYIDNFDDINVPILGICLGHQLIAKSFGGDVSSSSTESYAQIEIDIIDEDNLFEGISSPMKVWTSHKDEVKTLPKDFKILAKSSICDIEAMKHIEKDIYGIQFHPEVHHTPEGEFIFKNFLKICENKI
ncbi:GMP synthase [glutamine-hydrolyzing] [bioreactor metagenome]|uniref:GMP synthase [glutamine-hydrolyzing] n=1 Tax=bioreactor metagenome TaxID=1076179 RepID=A0A644T7U2_9ZZZZ|nr:GMP synthase subunit A [Methanobrevibacter sp.]MEA4957402.1 GMP synthase subunit A [Methanobrevibacter sp.]